MKIGIISDIHANAIALEEVLRNLQLREVDLIINTGDLVGYAPYPNEVIELLIKHDVVTVMGNYDEAVYDHQSLPNAFGDMLKGIYKAFFLLSCYYIDMLKIYIEVIDDCVFASCSRSFLKNSVYIE